MDPRMPHWILTSTLQRALSRLPGRARLNLAYQKYWLHSGSLSDEYFFLKWSETERHVKRWLAHPGAKKPFVALDLGVPCFPIEPIGLALAGASTVYAIDVQDLADRRCVVQVLE